MSYDPSGMAQNGVTTQHVLPATLTQYGRHYGAQTMQSYSLPGNPWLPQYVMQPAPHITQMEVSINSALRNLTYLLQVLLLQNL